MISASTATNPRDSHLRKTAAISDVEGDAAVDAAVDADVANPGAARFRFASGHEITVAAAVEAHLPAKAAMDHPDRSAKFKRNMIRTAILLAHPVKA